MRDYFSQLLLVLCGAGVMLLSGCIQPKPKDAMERSQLGIDIGIKNVGNERIDGAYVRFGDYVFRAGIVSAGQKAVHVDSGQFVPDQAEVGYKLRNGEDVVRVVSVKEHMPTNSADNMALYFVVDGERHVTVEFLHFVHVDGKWTLVEY